MRRRYITAPLVLASLTAVIIGFWISNSGFGAESVAWDTDCSGDTTSADAFQVLRHTTGISPDAPCLGASDVDCSGRIDAADALAILRFVAELPEMAGRSHCPATNSSPPEPASTQGALTPGVTLGPTATARPTPTVTPNGAPTPSTGHTPMPSGTPSGNGGGFHIVVPVYNNAGLEQALTTLSPHVRDGDMFVVISGNFNPINTSWMNDAAQMLKAKYPGTTILAGTSGLGNIAQAAAEVVSPIEGLVYVYEPNFPNEPEFTWDFETTLSFFDQVAEMAHAHGLRAIGKPTGRPVLQTSLEKYAWDYGFLGARMDAMFVQTQTYCTKGAEAYGSAIDTLVAQFNEAGSGTPWVSQVTVNLDVPNGVPVLQAVECVNVARQKGVGGVLMWWSSAYVEAAAEFLQLLGR